MSHIIWTFDMECSHVNRPTVMFLQLFLFILNQTFEITCFTVVLFHSIECEEFSLLVYLKGQLYVYVIVYLLLLRPLHQQQLSNVSNLWPFSLSLQRLQSLTILSITPARTPLSLCLSWGRAFRNELGLPLFLLSCGFHGLLSSAGCRSPQRLPNSAQ